MDADLEEVYAWGWDELHRLDEEMAGTAAQIAPGASLDEALAVLKDDPARSIVNIDQLIGFLQERTDKTIAELNGTQFDIPELIRRVE